MSSPVARKGVLVAVVAVTTALSTWLAVEVTRRQSDPAMVPDVELGPNATALEMKWSTEGVGDRFTPLPDASVDMTFLPNLRSVRTWKTRVPLSTNTAGFRYPHEFEPKEPRTFRVIVLGDSFVASAAARFEDGAAPQLQAILERAIRSDAGGRPPEIEVYPVGIGGWNIISELDYLIHNLHVLQPDVVVHVVNGNDLDSGYGFVLGNYRSASYDAQRVFGSTYVSIASPKLSQGFARAKGLVASYLIPESRRRYTLAAERIDRLQDLLQRHFEAPYFMCVLTPALRYGFGESLRGIVPPARVLLGPRAMRGNSLAPLDRHPNREGYRYLALALAHALHDHRVLSLDPASLAEEGAYDPYSTLESNPASLGDAMESFAVDEIPAVARADGERLRPRRAARGVVGGVYRGTRLSPESIFALARAPEATHLDVVVTFPAKPALDGGTLAIWIDGVRSAELPMEPGRQSVRVALPETSDEVPSVPLVEVSLRADRYYTDPRHEMIDGVFGYAPKVGRLVRLEVSSGSG